ncbi:hypothetical protein V6G44_005637 [Burkholderia multivorans]|uniref:hypothetical protein n=1 Tax=Burkholderia multivorans TaxID=87883 RepID=UPI00158D588A|nr:hypothetical protein [Burkholderia multivorans]MBU9584182.1 hypothetical protein [Burkholderia multivorans]MBU9649755.1 hypothetical protein [Burkholderia multivorans]MCA8142851.1 hypothetical protein [Burkholderia multivorans]MCA8259854.1 hypothetical protein [Burkholderia multivorans]MCA8375071.1 hypothetical protein [Burkholderia multivorans]
MRGLQPVDGIRHTKLEDPAAADGPRECRIEGPDDRRDDAGKIALFAGRPHAARRSCRATRAVTAAAPVARCSSPRHPPIRATHQAAGPAPAIAHSTDSRFEEPTMARIGAFCITTWLAAAILYFGQHSVAMIALSGVVVFGGFDLLRP